MKTSIKILMAATCLVLAVLVWYDLRVRDAYATGNYKHPLSDFTALNFKDFDEIDVNGCTAANVIVKQGPFNIEIDPTQGFTRVSQTGKALHIDAVFNTSFYTPRSAYVLVITCPQLKKFVIDSKYMASGKLSQDTLASEDFKWRPSFIEGFTADSLSIEEHHAGAVILKGNNIRSLEAVMGIGNKARSDMIILPDNHIGNADLDIKNQSQLKLDCKNIQNLQYRLADSAKLIVNGATRQLLKQ